MRKVIAWELMTLDGYFEGPTPWDLSFHEDVWGDELEQFSLAQLDEAGVLLFGRRTYEGMAAYWPTEEGDIARRMNSLPKIVFSSTLHAADWAQTRLVRDSAEEEVRKLKAEDGKDLFIFGSATLVASLMDAGLMDEYRICLTPRVLGSGNPLFKGGEAATKLALLDAQPLTTGGVILRYRAG